MESVEKLAEQQEGEQEASQRGASQNEQSDLRQMSSRAIGNEGERLAREFLKRRGYRIVESNWRCAAGEADIVACNDENTYVLVEVKTRLTLDTDEAVPELAVGRRKCDRYRRIALFYLAKHPAVQAVRFDVIALNIVGEHTARLRHLIGAFEWEE